MSCPLLLTVLSLLYAVLRSNTDFRGAYSYIMSILNLSSQIDIMIDGKYSLWHDFGTKVSQGHFGKSRLLRTCNKRSLFNISSYICMSSYSLNLSSGFDNNWTLTSFGLVWTYFIVTNFTMGSNKISFDLGHFWKVRILNAYLRENYYFNSFEQVLIMLFTN
jgi:hypothetical protein